MPFYYFFKKLFFIRPNRNPVPNCFGFMTLPNIKGGSLHLLNMDGFQASFARNVPSICSALEKQHHLPLRTVPSICSALEKHL